MNGQQNDDFQQSFNENLNAMIGNNNSIYIDAWVEKCNDFQSDNKEVWAVKFLLSSSTFSLNKIIVIGSSQSSKKKAESIVKSVKDWYNGFLNLKEAFEITSDYYLNGRNDIEEQWQQDCVNNAIKFVRTCK